MSEKHEGIPVNIGNINDGAMIEGFDLAFQQALQNIGDLNTPATATRGVILTLLLKPHPDRVTIETEFKVTARLAPIEVHRSKCFLGRSKGGDCVAFASDPRQMPLWERPKPSESVIQFGEQKK